MTRTERVVARMNERLRQICAAVPPVVPPSAHWMDSDAGPSFCFDCAVKARGKEFELGPPLAIAKWYNRDEVEDAFYAGIDGGFDTHSDNAEACDTCRRTLSYILTDEGVLEELDYWLECPLVEVTDEAVYALDRLALNVWPGHPNKRIVVGVSAAVNQAWRLLQP